VAGPLTRAIAERAALPMAEPESASVATRPKRSQRLIGRIVRQYERAPAVTVGGTFLVFWASLAAIFGPLVAAGVAAIVLCHELGHWVAFRQLRIWATAPIFLPLIGACVITKARARSRQGFAWAVLAGPISGLAAVAVTLALAHALHSPLVREWAVIGAIINLVNLLPIPGLDGGTIGGAVVRRRRGRWTLAAFWLATAFSTNFVLVQALPTPTG
jgi:Zn-dependent protease